MKVISTTKAPAAIGPYSQAIQVGNLVYTSGQIPIDPATGNQCEGYSRRSRIDDGKCSKDNGVHGRYERLCGYERRLCRLFLGAISRTFCRRGKDAAERRVVGD